MLDNTPNQPFKFTTKDWVEKNDELHETHNTNIQIKFKTSVLRSTLCDYSDAYILVSRTIAVVALAAGRGNNGIEEVFKNWAAFSNCISGINNAQVDNAKDIHVLVPMYNLIEYRNNYSKTSGRLWQYYRDEPALNNTDTLVDFPGNSASFKYKI